MLKRNKSLGLIIVFFVALLCIQGCSYEEMLKKIVSEEDLQFAQTFAENLRQGNQEEVKKWLHPELASKSDMDSILKKVVDAFPKGNLIEAKIIGAQINTSDNTRSANLTFQYHFEKGWVLVILHFIRDDKNITVHSFRVTPISQSLESTHAFTLENKTSTHYLFLFLAAGILILVIYSLILCVKTPMPKRKWLWIVFILMGFTATSINWTTGETNFNPISVHLLGTGVMSGGPYSPWNISISIPLGAIFFLIKRKIGIAKKQNSS